MTDYFLCFYCNIYEIKPDILEIFRTFSRYLEKKSEISGNIFRRFFVTFVSRPSLSLPFSEEKLEKASLKAAKSGKPFE